MTELKGRWLEPKIPARWDLQDESKVDVHQVPQGVDQNIAIVAVFGLQEIACNCIPAVKFLS